MIHCCLCFGFMWALKSDLGLNLETLRRQRKSYGNIFKHETVTRIYKWAWIRSSSSHARVTSAVSSYSNKILFMLLLHVMMTNEFKLTNNINKINTKPDQLLPMRQINENLKIRFSFEFGNTKRTKKIIWKHFHWSSWTSVVWHFKESFKLKFFSQDLHCPPCVSKSKMKCCYKVHIQTMHVQLLNRSGT